MVSAINILNPPFFTATQNEITSYNILKKFVDLFFRKVAPPKYVKFKRLFLGGEMLIV
jgi:hypothetical protein